MLFSLLVATPAAYALAQFRVRGAGVVLFGILISQMIPGIVVANALYSAYSDLGLLNSIPGLILADSTHGIPFAILIMRAYLLAIPGEVIEAARVDGAGQVRAFVSIVVPMSRNALVTAALFTFLFTWSDFLFALTLTTTERSAAGNAGHLPVHRDRRRQRLELGNGHRRARLHPGRRAAAGGPAFRRRRCRQRCREMTERTS